MTVGMGWALPRECKPRNLRARYPASRGMTTSPLFTVTVIEAHTLFFTPANSLKHAQPRRHLCIHEQLKETIARSQLKTEN